MQNRNANPAHRIVTRLALLALFLMLARPIPADGTIHLAPPREPVPPSLFGMHFHHVGGVTPWPDVPIPEWRLWDAHTAWPDLEPNKGQWHFQTLDAYLTLAAQHHTDVLLPLGLSPQWASARPTEKSTYQPGFAAEPRNIDDWREYVATVVAHCKGRVRAYEIWNEPNSKSFWTGNVSQMVALTQAASAIIRRIDPQAIIVSPSATTSSGVGWLSQFLQMGGGQYVDVIGYHFYVAPQPPEAMIPLIQRVKQVMAENGVGDKPLWNTESAWPSPRPFPSEDLAAGYLARAYILNWAAGVQRLYWYAWDNHTFDVTQTTRQDNQTLTPAGRAYGIIQKWLVGARMDACNEGSDHTWTCRLTRNGTPEWIIWNTGGTTPFSIPRSWNAGSVTPLLEQPHAVASPNFEVGPVPELLTASSY
ncbi:MAG: glycosyl hydrolase [Candidatus Acidiferrales bacterium]